MNKPKARRGFAAMSEDKQREISSKGGRKAHELGLAHRFTSLEAQQAGRRGGEVVASDRYHMARIGAKGGRARGHQVAKKRELDALHTEAMDKLKGEGQQHIKEIREETAHHGTASDGMPTLEIDPNAGKVAIEIPVLRRHNLKK